MVYVNFGDAETVPNFLLYGVNNVIATIVVDICKKLVLLKIAYSGQRTWFLKSSGGIEKI